MWFHFCAHQFSGNLKFFYSISFLSHLPPPPLEHNTKCIFGAWRHEWTLCDAVSSLRGVRKPRKCIFLCFSFTTDEWGMQRRGKSEKVTRIWDFFFGIVFRRLTLMTCMTNIWLTLEHIVARRMRRRKIILNLTMKFLCKLFACFIWFLSRSAPVSCGALGLRIFEAAWQSARIWLGGGRNIKTNYDEWSINSVNLLTKLSKNGRMLQITMTIAKIELSHAIVNRRIKTCASVCCEVGASTQFHGRYEIELDQVSCVDRSSKLTAIVRHRLS